VSLKKSLALTILILAPCCYAACLLKLPFIFIIFFVGLFYTPLFFLLAKVIHALLPKDTKQKFEKHHLRFHLTILWCLILLVFGREVISNHYMADTIYLIRLPAKLALLAFTMFYCWIIFKNGWKRKTVICTIIYLLFILVPIIKTSITYNPDANDSSNLEKLNTLGYVEWVHDEHDIDKVSVTTYDPNLSCDGLNLYTSQRPGHVFLIDMKGNILHEWNLDPDDKYFYVWPYVDFCKNADILAFCKESIFARVGWKSNRVWGQKIRVHHGFYADQNQDIYALNRKDSVALWRGLPISLIEDYITVFSPNGDFKKNIFFLNAAKKYLTFKGIIKIYRYLLNPDKIKEVFRRKLHGKPLFQISLTFDVLHTNSVHVIERNIEGLCKKGDILISMRDLDLVAILNPEKTEFVWEWGPGIISAQHHATLLGNNNILLFDNGYSRGYSRIIEINPIFKKITWQYQADPPEDFSSPRRGSCQRLPNGNTLITESDSGNVFEVTKTGKIVWRFYVPEINKETNKRQAIYRMIRITNPQEYPLLKNL
jgi:hypothetical protein